MNREDLRRDLAVVLLVILSAAAVLLAWIVIWGLSIMISNGGL